MVGRQREPGNVVLRLTLSSPILIKDRKNIFKSFNIWIQNKITGSVKKIRCVKQIFLLN